MIKGKVSLALVDTESYTLANNAIHSCVSNFDFVSVHILTDRCDLWPNYNTFQIPKIKKIDDYNNHIIQTLPKLIETPFCIVAQFDGFILNGSSFSESFFEFDYIGAVWPEYPYMNVGNGGFSWRSKRLMDAVFSLSHLRQPNEPEDLFICRTIRVILEDRYNCIFADESTAKMFSYEIAPSTFDPFGFHGVFNLPLIYKNNLEFLIENLPQRVLKSGLPFLAYGANQLPQDKKDHFDSLIKKALIKLESTN